MAIPVTFDKVGVGVVLIRLAQSKQEGAAALYARIMSGWGARSDRQWMTLAANPEEIEVLRSLKLPGRMRNLGMLQCGWLVTYRHPTKPNLEVVVHSTTKPSKRRSFKMPGGVVRLTAVEAYKINQEASVATRTRKAKKNVEVDEDELDELEALEELDDDEDDELDEPVDEADEDEEDEEDEEPGPKRKRKPAAKKAPAKKKRKAAPVDEDEDDEDEDDEDDDEDEDDEPAPKRGKGKTRQGTAKTKAKSAKRQPPAPRPLPAGKLSPQDIADEAGVQARDVRIFLRAHEDEYPKPEGSFRYAFGKKEAAKLIRQIKKDRA